jgi:hypothetical protein
MSAGRLPLTIAEYEAFKLANPLLQMRVETPDISKDEAMLRGDFDFAEEKQRIRITQAAYERMRKLSLLPSDAEIITARDGIMTASELLKKRRAEINERAVRAGCQCGMCQARWERDKERARAAAYEADKLAAMQKRVCACTRDMICKTCADAIRTDGLVRVQVFKPNRCDCPGCAPFRRKYPSPIGEHPVHAAMRRSGLNTPDNKRVGAAQYRSW